MKSQLADLEELLFQIKDESIKSYAKEAVICYQNGAYRAAIVSIWVAVAFDIFKKIQFVAEQFQDGAAKQCLQDIENLRKSNPQNISIWEKEIVEKAYSEMKFITETEKKHLERIREDRHLCAHPALDREEKLFIPDPELARTHIRTAIDVLLSKMPVMGKAAVELFIQEIESPAYFPNDIDGIARALEDRGLIGTDSTAINLFKICLKKILVLSYDPQKGDESKFIRRYLLSFIYLKRKFTNLFNTFDPETFRVICNRPIDEVRFLHLKELLMEEPSIWNVLTDHLKERFKAYITTNDSSFAVAYPLLLNVEERLDLYKGLLTRIGKYNYPNINKQSSCLRLINKLGLEDRTSEFIAGIIKHNIDLFTESSCFDNATERAQQLIEPVIKYLNIDDVKYLLEKASKNDELGHFGGIDQLAGSTFILVQVLQGTEHIYPEIKDQWNDFYELKKDVWTGMDELADLISNLNQ